MNWNLLAQAFVDGKKVRERHVEDFADYEEFCKYAELEFGKKCKTSLLKESEK